jgi:hypothetical protein
VNVGGGLKTADLQHLVPVNLRKGKQSFSSIFTGRTILRGLLRILRSSLNGVQRTPKQWIDSSPESILSYQ